MTARVPNSLLAALPIIVLLQLAGCASQTGVVSDSVDRLTINADVSTVSGRAATIAAQQLGIPYRYGGSTPNGFDCSGLVYYSYQQAGLATPRTSAAQFSAARPIELREARPGDLLFFATQKSVTHVGIYVGDNTFVHAPSSGKTVSVARITDAYYRDHFVAAGRLVD
jgi:cell wall-associated NlpC family hydrolase